MLRANKRVYHKNSVYQYAQLWQDTIPFDCIRQWGIRLTVLLIGLFYTCAVLEVDLSDINDTFGDVYDTYVPGSAVKSPKPIVAVDQHILLGLPPLDRSNNLLLVRIDWLVILVLPRLAFYLHGPPKHRRFQVLHAIWRI
jgi:hypothetical protein